MSRSPSVREPLLSESKSESSAISASVAAATAVMIKYRAEKYSDVAADIRQFCRGNTDEATRQAFVDALFEQGLSLPIDPHACLAVDVGLLGYRYKPPVSSGVCCFMSLFRSPVGRVNAVADNMKQYITEKQGSGACAVFLPTEAILYGCYKQLNALRGSSPLLDDVRQLVKDSNIDLKQVEKEFASSFVMRT